MSKGLRNAVLLLVACVLYVGFTAGFANACTLVQTKWGYRAQGECFLFQDPPALKQPNLRVRSAEASPFNREVEIDVEGKNYGSVGTEGLIATTYSFGGGGNAGAFDITAHVEVRDLAGNLVQIADDYSWHNSLQFRTRSSALGAGDARDYYLGTIYLPNRDFNYDVCITATIDSKNASTGGEIAESNETDNTRRTYTRLFPAVGGLEDPNNEAGTTCFAD